MLSEDELKDFYQNYRESLSKQYESGLQNLDQQRRNAQASIMSGANKAGMMYSNFPERSKLQFDTESYIPSQVKLKNTYQTGLDTLRSNILKHQNNITDIQEAISSLNASYGGGGGTGGGTGGTGGSGGASGDGGSGGDGSDGSDGSNEKTEKTLQPIVDLTVENEKKETAFYPITPTTWPKQYVKEMPFLMGGGYSYTIPGQGTIDVESGRTLVLKDGKYYTVKQYGRNGIWGDPKQVWPH